MQYKETVCRVVCGFLREFRLNERGNIMDRHGLGEMTRTLLEEMNKKKSDLYGKNERERIANLLMERDGPCCGICGEGLGGKIEIDHIVSWLDGGTHTADNIRLTHRRCNRMRPRRKKGRKFGVTR